MAKKVFNMQGGLHSAAAYSALENRAWGSCVANAASLVVTPGAGMNVNISSGDGLISVDAFNARRIQVTATETAAVPAANASFNRIDSVVAYIDTAVAPTTAVIDNINDVLKFKVVAGTAAATPAAPTGAAIQASIGAGNPYVVLYDLLLPQGATNVAGITLTDKRKILTDPVDLAVTTAKLAALAVTNAKIAANAVDQAKTDNSGQAFAIRGLNNAVASPGAGWFGHQLDYTVASGGGMTFPAGHQIQVPRAGRYSAGMVLRYAAGTVGSIGVRVNLYRAGVLVQDQGAGQFGSFAIVSTETTLNCLANDVISYSYYGGGSYTPTGNNNMATGEDRAFVNRAWATENRL